MNFFDNVRIELAMRSKLNDNLSRQIDALEKEYDTATETRRKEIFQECSNMREDVCVREYLHMMQTLLNKCQN